MIFRLSVKIQNQVHFIQRLMSLIFAFTKEKKKVFLKELPVFIKVSIMYVSVHLQYYQNETLNSPAGRGVFPFAL